MRVRVGVRVGVRVRVRVGVRVGVKVRVRVGVRVRVEDAHGEVAVKQQKRGGDLVRVRVRVVTCHSKYSRGGYRALHF